MKETGADHVLYGTKIYDSNDRLVTVQFCVRPMMTKNFTGLLEKRETSWFTHFIITAKADIPCKIQKSINFSIDQSRWDKIRL